VPTPETVRQGAGPVDATPYSQREADPNRYAKQASWLPENADSVPLAGAETGRPPPALHPLGPAGANV